MLTKKFTDFSADLLDAVRGVLGEAKKCSDCGCAKCECEDEEGEDMEESTAEYGKSIDAQKKKNIAASDQDKISRLAAMMKAEKKPIKLTKGWGDGGKSMKANYGKLTKEDQDFIDSLNDEMFEEIELDEAVSVSHDRYIRSHGKKASGGEGSWMFTHKERGDAKGEDRFEAPRGKFSDAKKHAQKWAKERGHHTIYVMEEVEQIDEWDISKMPHDKLKLHSTVPHGRYTRKEIEAEIKRRKSTGEYNSNYQAEEADYLETDLKKRKKNNDKAIKDMKKMGSPMRNPAFGEEVEQIDELSDALLKNYSKKALAQSKTATGDQKLKRQVGARNAIDRLGNNTLAKEEAEQIDEISGKTLASYSSKVANYGPMKDAKTREKHEKGLYTAYKKMKAKDVKVPARMEEVEQIDELSKATMGRYINKAATKIGTQGVTAGLKIASDENSKKNFKDMGKREKGIARAVNKLTKEEQDFIDALNNDTLEEARGRPKKAGGKDFTIHPKTKEKLMHNNPEHMKKIELLQKHGVLDKPKTEAGQHIINQLQKAKTSMTGGATIHFTHGDSKHVSGTHAAKVLDKYAGMKPNEKEDFQKKIGHSHEQLMKHV